MFNQSLPPFVTCNMSTCNRGNRGGYQRMPSHQSANLVIARTESHMCDMVPCVSNLQPEVFVLLSMFSDAMYLRLNPHLVVKIYSDILREYCCQVCVLSMLFCRSDCWLCTDLFVSDYAIRKLECNVVWFNSRQANVGNDMKKIFLLFDFHILPQQRHIGAKIIPCHCISIKKILHAIQFTGNRNCLWNCWIVILDRIKMTFISIHITANQN